MAPRRKRGRETVSTPDAKKLVKRKRDLDPDILQSPIRSKPLSSPSVSQLGYANVKTLLRSGNVIFDAEEALGPDAAPSVEAAVRTATGVQSSVLLFSAHRFAAIADANPLLEVATDGSKSFVSFVEHIPADLERPDSNDLVPEVLHIGEDAIYQWMPLGFLKTVVPKSFWKQFDSPVTTRNWNTVNKILALLQ